MSSGEFTQIEKTLEIFQGIGIHEYDPPVVRSGNEPLVELKDKQPVPR